MEGNLVVMVFAIVSWAEMSCWTMLVCPPVSTRFPFIDQFAEDMCTCCALDIWRDLLMVLQMVWGAGQLVISSALMCTTILGWGGVLGLLAYGFGMVLVSVGFCEGVVWEWACLTLVDVRC